MVFREYYCDQCQKEFEEFEIEYNEYPNNCNRWQCNLLNWAYVCFLIAITTALILVIPIMEFFEYIRSGKKWY